MIGIPLLLSIYGRSHWVTRTWFHPSIQWLRQDCITSHPNSQFKQNNLFLICLYKLTQHNCNATLPSTPHLSFPHGHMTLQCSLKRGLDYTEGQFHDIFCPIKPRLLPPKVGTIVHLYSFPIEIQTEKRKNPTCRKCRSRNASFCICK